MKAFVCKEFGPVESHVIEDIPEPEAGDGQVVVDIKATGISFPDVLIVQGLYQFKPPFPFSPGSEIAGIVSSVGNGVTKFKEGDRVMGNIGSGGLVEKGAFFETQLMSLPESMDFKIAAGFSLNYGTTIHGLKQRAELKPNESILILGAGGGLGITAIHVAKAMGAKVIAAVSSEDKLELCKKEGADEGILYLREMDRDAQKKFSSEIKEISGGGVEVIYDIVGGDYSEPALRAIKRHGRYLVVGFTAGIPKMPLNLTLLKECQIIGVFWGQFAGLDREVNAENFKELFQMHAEGKIKPFISETFPLERAGEAIKTLADRKVLGKIVVSME
ncbi:MAG: NADPH:quinone oxidoreductase family protein [SAR86 cluster bacterium]|jgi:NADPH2:quinone reductase|nr:NADPH:quinone oxidoreductase family protein [SAR86 cluster bacterium]